MILFGNVFGGIFVIAWHLIVVTNIDNVLRPILIPRQARLDSALMLLAVFAGITMFGFLGIVIGPVLMIVIVTTISVYLAVFKGVPIDDPDHEDEPKAPGPIARLIARAREHLWARRDEERRKAQNAATPRTAAP
jgi:predicted PurR-regulated permease PerM